MFIVIHYSEIGLKGKNRGFFEKKLIGNIGKALSGTKKIYRRYGKVIVEVGNIANKKKYIKKLAFVPGISSFSIADKADLEMGSIKDKAFEMFSVLSSRATPHSLRGRPGIQKESGFRLKGRNDKYSRSSWNTFRITTFRSNKLFTKNSNEINVLVGEVIRKKLGKKVNLDNPDVTLFIEISEKEAFLYTQKHPGPGGLPVGSSGKAVALLSGGIDSPAASFLAMKRGLKVVFVHVLNKTIGGEQRSGVEKIKKIVQELTKIQGKSKLYTVPFEEIQKIIIAEVPAELRMIVYRRFMMKIATKVAEKEKAKGIITGDSVGQVASQTLPNLKCVYESTDLPVLPPLIGMNKEEIVKIAKEIGTYDLSIIPYPDCCSFMIAKHPETGGRIEDIKRVENLIADKEKLIKNCISKAKINFSKE